jgi:hypothetical protein
VLNDVRGGNLCRGLRVPNRCGAKRSGGGVQVRTRALALPCRTCGGGRAVAHPLPPQRPTAVGVVSINFTRTSRAPVNVLTTRSCCSRANETRDTRYDAACSRSARATSCQFPCLTSRQGSPRPQQDSAGHVSSYSQGGRATGHAPCNARRGHHY